MNDKYMMLLKEMSSDCENCSGLCCVALCYRKSDGFPGNKPVGRPCEYLTPDFKCRIHNKLSDMNMKGCLNYECLGAGQKVSNIIFNRQNWAGNPEISKVIFEVFIKVLQLHQILWYLIQAASIGNDKNNIDNLDKYIFENNKITSLPYNDILNYDLEEYRVKANETIKKSFRFNFDQNGKDYSGKDFNRVNLDGRDFSMAFLIGANLEGCSLDSASFLGADMRDSVVRNTDLSNSYFLTQMQINSTIGNNSTKIPAYLKRPVHWKK